MTGYTDTIRLWATDTRRAGVLPNADGTGEIGLDSKELGSRLAVRFAIKVELDVVTDVRYQVFGCGFSMAACAVAADLSIGCSLDEVQKISERHLDEALEGLPAERDYCASLAVQALRAAVKSAGNQRRLFQASLRQAADHAPVMTANEPLYATLIQSPKPEHIACEDRHLFACLLSVAARSPLALTAALGLEQETIVAILQRFFPAIEYSSLLDFSAPVTKQPGEKNAEVLSIILSHLSDHAAEPALWLAHILTARAAQPGHLWVSMGLFKRTELSAAIRRHLPSLAAANHQNMRWKRYLFKQVCDRNGGTMCKSPNCGICSDYALCFAEDE